MQARIGWRGGKVAGDRSGVTVPVLAGLVALSLTVAVLAAVLVPRREASHRRAADLRETVVAADRSVRVHWPRLSGRCGRAAAAARQVVSHNRYFADVDLTEMQRYLDSVGSLYAVCHAGEYQQLLGRLTLWEQAAPATYRTDRHAMLSSRCARAVAGVRVRLARDGGRVGGGITEWIDTLLRDARQATEGACTDAERKVFTVAELDPVRRRAMASGGGDSPELPFTDTVSGPPARAQLSPGCTAAMAPVRGYLTSHRDHSLGADGHEHVQRLLAATVGRCTSTELHSFQLLEIDPALGLTPLGPAPRG